MKKLLALLMAMVLVFSLAACGGNTEEPSTDPSTEAPASSENVAPSSEEDSSAAPSSENDSSENESESGNAPVAMPQNAADAVKFYNDALAKVAGTKASVNRKLEVAKVLGIDLDTFGPVSKTFADGSGPVNAKLVALNAGDVASYTPKDNGNTFEMKFALKNVKGDMNSKHGMGGYMYYLTLDEVAGVVKEIGDMLSGGSIKIDVYKDKSSFELQGGALTVTVDKATGKMTNATLTFKEVIKGKCKAPIKGPIAINADANITGGGTVTFKLS